MLLSWLLSDTNTTFLTLSLALLLIAIYVLLNQSKGWATFLLFSLVAFIFLLEEEAYQYFSSWNFLRKLEQISPSPSYQYTPDEEVGDLLSKFPEIPRERPLMTGEELDSAFASITPAAELRKPRVRFAEDEQ